MCVGVPMRVVEAGVGEAACEGRGARARIDLALVGPQEAGTWLLAFNGRAVRVLSEEEARRTGDALDALEAALAGDGDLDRFFADLAGREPRLPEHLR